MQLIKRNKIVKHVSNFNIADRLNLRRTISAAGSNVFEVILEDDRGSDAVDRRNWVAGAGRIPVKPPPGDLGVNFFGIISREAFVPEFDRQRKFCFQFGGKMADLF